MSVPNLRLEAYRKTGRVIAREYAFRVAAVCVVAALLAIHAGFALAAAWAAVLSALLRLEVRLYRTLTDGERSDIGAGAMATIGANSLLCNAIALIPVFAFLHHGTPAAYFAASAYMAGMLINLMINNSAHPVILGFAVAPFAVVYLGVGISISLKAADPTAAYTSTAFVISAAIAYRALIENVRGYERAAAESHQEREAALRASQAKSEFLAKMSHEVRTPLNGVLGMAQAMGADELTPAQKDRLQIIADSGAKLLAILNDVLDHAKIESGGLALDPAPASIAAIVERAAARSRETAGRKGLTLSLDLSAVEVDAIVIDAVRLEQCLSEIVSNAVKFTSAGGVFLSARSAGSGAGEASLSICVRDTGPGMNDDERARAFEPFEQADNSIRRRYGGTGLGLAVSRSIARTMGGDIAAASAPGRGSEFTLTLTAPVAPAGSGLQAPPASPPRPSVLVVEDNLVNFQVVKAMIENYAASVAHAENGAAALARLDTERFDVIFMDMHMPVMDGLSATREIRAAKAAWSTTPIIFVTAAASAEDEGSAYASGADAFIAKPVKAEALLRALSNAARRAA